MSFLETRMPMTEKTMNEVLRARIQDRIKELTKGLNRYRGFNEDGSDAPRQFMTPSYSSVGRALWQSAPAIIEELKNLLK